MTDSAAPAAARYVWAEGWGHYFSDNAKESNVRWIWNTQTEELLHVEVEAQDGWRLATPDEAADMRADVATNAECLDNTEYWGIASGDELPAWGPSHHELMSRSRAAVEREALAAKTLLLDRWDALEAARAALAAALAERLARALPAGAVVTPGAPGPAADARVAGGPAGGGRYRLTAAPTVVTDAADPAAWRWRAPATALGGAARETPDVLLEAPILPPGPADFRERLRAWIAATD